MDRIIIKLGSGLLTDGLGNIKQQLIADVCRQLHFLVTNNTACILVSSGAVASDPHLHRSDNLRAVVGQPELMRFYKHYFDQLKTECGQILVTDLDFANATVLTSVITEAAQEKVVLIFNANDATSNKELEALNICEDNDALTQMICQLAGVKIDAVVIGIDQAGLLDQNKKVVPLVSNENYEQFSNQVHGCSSLGKKSGGINFKIKIAHELALSGIKTILAPAAESDFILQALDRLNGNRHENFGTIFI